VFPIKIEHWLGRSLKISNFIGENKLILSSKDLSIDRPPIVSLFTMASMIMSAVITFLVFYLLKYLKKYIRQLRDNYSMPNPGFPLPFLGHSYLFLNVQKEDILALAMEQSSKDTICRKFYSVIGPNTMVS